MKLENFSLAHNGGVELRAFGHNWDLHNCVDFRGLHYAPLSNDVVLEWVPLPEYAANPWGDTTNKAACCRLRFREVHALRLGPRDDSYPASEATCVDTIELVNAADSEILVFTMQDARVIEIAAASAILEREL